MKKRNVLRSFGAMLMIVTVLLALWGCEKKKDEKGGTAAPEQGSEIQYYADIVVDEYGTVTLGLDGRYASATVENFVTLAKEGFYDGLTFHRIMSGFMIQGGCPEGTGYGGSGKTIPGEFSSNGYENPLSHTRGAVSMARSKIKDSASSQFFIVHQDSTFLDGDYAVFGYVTEGMDVVDAICEKVHPIDSNGTVPKEDQPVIRSITIREPEQKSE